VPLVVQLKKTFGALGGLKPKIFDQTLTIHIGKSSP
jgi:hypothetical protein